jgi:hypothetical protein
MARFAEAADLEDFLQNDVTTAPAELALDIASGIVRAYVGWSISQETVVLVTEGDGGNALWLPTKLLTAVTSVEVDGELLTFGDHYRWTSSGRLRRIGASWPCLERSIEVTFTHGYNPVPDDIKGITLALAGRLYDNPEGLRSWSVDGLSETIANPSSDAGLALTTVEKAALDSYLLEGVS